MQSLAILNLTPDSFSDGDQANLDPGFSVAKAQEFLKQGADFIDIGAESTRPGADEISFEQEWSRLKTFLDEFQEPVLSLDSRNPKTIELVFKNHGAKFLFLNDVTGLQNPDLLKVVAEHIDPKVKLISMHSKGGVPPSIRAAEIPDDFYEQGLLEDFKSFWDKTIGLCNEYGIDQQRIILDPGLGFGKNLQHSLELIELIPSLKQEFGLPVLIGASRKSFLKLWQPGKDLDELSQQYQQLCLEQGAEYLRLHKV